MRPHTPSWRAGPAALGLIGHSEGGMLAAMIAADPTAQPAFIVSLGPLGTPGVKAIPRQMRLMASRTRLQNEDIDALTSLQRQLWQLTTTPDAEGRRAELPDAAASAARRTT